MGQTYSVNVGLCFKMTGMAEDFAYQALKRFITQYAGVNFNLERFEKEGVSPDNGLSDCIRIILAGFKVNSYEMEEESSHKGSCFDIHNDFEASYGWESVMEEAFRTIDVYLIDGSYIEIYPDHGYTRLEIKGGKCVQYGQEEDANPYFENGDELCEHLFDEGDLYNASLHILVRTIPDTGMVEVVELGEDLGMSVAAAANEGRAGFSDILDKKHIAGSCRTSVSLTEDEAAGYLDKKIFGESDYAVKHSENWIYANDCAVYFMDIQKAHELCA